MTVIALPSNHDHLANALVRDLGFTRVHVDEPLRRLALTLDPLVAGGNALANMAQRSPRLTSKIEEAGGDWDKAIKKTPEIGRILDVLRDEFKDEFVVDLRDLAVGDTVIVGVDNGEQRVNFERTIPSIRLVAIAGRVDAGFVDHVIPEGSILEHEGAIVRYARSLDQAQDQAVTRAAMDQVAADFSKVKVATPDEYPGLQAKPDYRFLKDNNPLAEVATPDEAVETPSV